MKSKAWGMLRDMPRVTREIVREMPRWQLPLLPVAWVILLVIVPLMLLSDLFNWLFEAP